MDQMISLRQTEPYQHCYYKVEKLATFIFSTFYGASYLLSQMKKPSTRMLVELLSSLDRPRIESKISHKLYHYKVSSTHRYLLFLNMVEKSSKWAF